MFLDVLPTLIFFSIKTSDYLYTVQRFYRLKRDELCCVTFLNGKELLCILWLETLVKYRSTMSPWKIYSLSKVQRSTACSSGLGWIFIHLMKLLDNSYQWVCSVHACGWKSERVSASHRLKPYEAAAVTTDNLMQDRKMSCICIPTVSFLYFFLSQSGLHGWEGTLMFLCVLIIKVLPAVCVMVPDPFWVITLQYISHSKDTVIQSFRFKGLSWTYLEKPLVHTNK